MTLLPQYKALEQDWNYLALKHLLSMLDKSDYQTQELWNQYAFRLLALARSKDNCAGAESTITSDHIFIKFDTGS